MTVKELITKLQEYPQDTEVAVLYEMCSDLSILEADELEFYPTAGIPHYSGPRRFVLRNGRIMEYDEKTWDKNETPVFVPILVFPGN